MIITEITVGLGKTINTGYNSARFDVSLTATLELDDEPDLVAATLREQCHEELAKQISEAGIKH